MVKQLPYRSFFSRKLNFADFADFGAIRENKKHGGYGQQPGEIGNPQNLNPRKRIFSKSAKFNSLEKKDLYGNIY